MVDPLFGLYLKGNQNETCQLEGQDLSHHNIAPLLSRRRPTLILLSQKEVGTAKITTTRPQWELGTTNPSSKEPNRQHYTPSQTPRISKKTQTHKNKNKNARIPAAPKEKTHHSGLVGGVALQVEARGQHGAGLVGARLRAQGLDQAPLVHREVPHVPRSR